MKFRKVTKISDVMMPAWYYGKAYEIYDRNRVVWYPVGIHVIVKTARFIRQVWNLWRGKQTWFDRQMRLMFQEGVRAGYVEAVKQQNKSEHFIDDVKRKLGMTNKN